MSLTVDYCFDYTKHNWRPIHIEVAKGKVEEKMWCTNCGCSAKKLNGKFVPSEPCDELLMIPQCLIEA